MRAEREGEGWPWAMARGAFDKFPLFRRCANIVRCDITEDVELGCKHRDRLSHALQPFFQPIPIPQVAHLSASSDREHGLRKQRIVLPIC